jgi:hypothetical protein
MSSAATAAEAGVFVVLAVGRVDGGGTTGVLAVGLAVGVWRTPVLERPRRGFGMCIYVDVSQGYDRVCKFGITSSDSPKTFPESSASNFSVRKY